MKNLAEQRTCAFTALLIALALAFPLAGCKVGPDYHPPATTMPEGWIEIGSATGSTIAASAPATSPQTQPSTAPANSAAVPQPAENLQEWWNGFNDPVLNSLIEQAIAGNLDLDQAQARIRQARGARTIAGAPLYPSVDASAGVTRSYSGVSEDFSGPGGTSGGSRTSNLFRAGFDAAWELDVFGGTRRNVEAANADLQFAVEDLRSVLVSLTAETATTYFDLRGFQEQLDHARGNLEAQKQSADLTRQRFSGGYVSRLDVANADAQVATTSARIPSLESSIRQSMHALGVLLGKPPGAVVAELAAESPNAAAPILPPEVPVGLPSDLLRRRPDIRMAEANLHAATARIGVATADLFPKFSLTGSLGVQGSHISALSAVSDGFASIGPNVTWPVFAGGQIHANVDVQKAITDERYAAYQQTVLVALQEVEDALIAYSKEQQRRLALIDAVASNRQAVQLSTQLYTGGRTDFLNVLSAQRALLDAEDALAQSDTLVVTELVALYKALGGGWGASGAELPPGREH